MPPTKKRCSCCKVTKSVSEFYKNSCRRDGYGTSCKKCQNAYAKDWAKRNQEKVKRYDHDNKRRVRYGLTREQYAQLIAKYPECPICGKEFTAGLKPVVDHNHANSEVRALLCVNCNMLLGRARDDINILKSAIKYLRRFS